MDNNKTISAQDQIDVEKFHNASNISNLISLFDPDDLGMEEIEIIAEATNSTPEFINNLVNINHSAIKELGKNNTSPEQKEQAMQTFSLMKESVIGLALENNNIGLPINFSSGETKNRILNTIEMTRFVNPQILNNEPITDLAVAFSNSTFVPQDICEDILSKAKEQFSQGDIFSVNSNDVNEYEKEMNFSLFGFGKKKSIKRVDVKNVLGINDNRGVEVRGPLPSLKTNDKGITRYGDLTPKQQEKDKDEDHRLWVAAKEGADRKNEVKFSKASAAPAAAPSAAPAAAPDTEAPKTAEAPKESTNDLVNKLNSQNRNLKIGLGAAALGGLGYMGYKLYQKHKAKAEAMRQAQAMDWQRQMQAVPQYPNGIAFSNDPLAGTSLRDETEAHQGNTLIGNEGPAVSPVSNLTPLNGVLQSPSEKVIRANEEDPSNPQGIAGVLKQELNHAIPGNEAVGNFNNSFHVDNSSSRKQNNLITLLGDKYIPNK